jgi:hypothetical protein
MTAIQKAFGVIVVGATVMVFAALAIVGVLYVIPTLTVSSATQGIAAIDGVTRTRHVTITEVLGTIISSTRDVAESTSRSYAGVASVSTTRRDPVPVLRDPVRTIYALIPGELFFGVDLMGIHNFIGVDSTGATPIVTVTLPHVVCTGVQIRMDQATFDSDGGSFLASFDPMSDVGLVSQLQDQAEYDLSMQALNEGMLQQTAEDLEEEITQAINGIYPDCTVRVVFEQARSAQQGVGQNVASR